MDALLFNLFVGVLLISGWAKAGKSVEMIGSYKFLPYEKLTDEKFIEKRGEIAKATELKIERLAIPSIELLIKYLDNNTSIKRFYLNDVTFDSRLDEKKKINLPSIKEYQIYVRDVELENESEKNFITLQRFLLVEKQGDEHYLFTVQLGSQIYVEYKVYDRCIFRYFPPSSLPSNEFNCKYIKIFKQSIDLATLPTKLKELDLTDVEIYETSFNNTRGNRKLIDLNDILKYFPELSDLEIKYSNPPKYRIIFDLAYYSQRNLIYLSLSHCKVVSTEIYEEEHRVVIRNFICEHCDFGITNYTNLVISTTRIELRNNNYKTPNGFQKFISSVRNVEYLTVDEMYEFNLDWLHNGAVGSLEYIILRNLNYQKPKLGLSFRNVRYLSLLNIKVDQLGSSLSSSAFPNLERVETTDTNPDLIMIFSGNEKLEQIKICFPENILNGVNNTLIGREPRDFRHIIYERKNDGSWVIKKEYSYQGVPYKSQQYIQSYIWTIFIISSIGLIGNLLIIIVYTKQSSFSGSFQLFYLELKDMSRFIQKSFLTIHTPTIVELNMPGSVLLLPKTR